MLPTHKAKQHWERVLKSEGLGEIETRQGQVHSTLPSPAYVEAATLDGREDYFARAREFARSGRLRGKMREAYALHAEGVGLREIAKQMTLGSKHVAEDLVNSAKFRLGRVGRLGRVTSCGKRYKEALELIAETLWQTETVWALRGTTG